MNYRHFKYEGWLYGLAFLLALGLRLAKLGAIPLTDAEALPALQALHLAQGLGPALSPHPLYILATSLLFFLFGGGTNFLARFLPALMGSLLVFAPLLFANRLKPRPSLLLAFFIVFDPGLIALSRQAADSILAVTFLFLALGFANQNKVRLTGVFAALALLSGPSIWGGLLALGIAWALYQAMEYRSSRNQPTDPERPAFKVKETLLPFVVTFIIAGSLFFIAPKGLSAALASIPAYLEGWRLSSNVPSSRLLSSLLVYEPFGILLVLIAVVRGWRHGSKRIIPLSIWLLITLLLVAFMPSHQMSDLVWALPLLWAIAALELVRYVDIFSEERGEIIGVALLTIFVWVFAWLDFASLVWYPANSAQFVLRFWLFIGSIFLLVVSLLLVAAGWSIRTAKFGAIWGLAVALGALGLSGALGSAGLRDMSHPELWWPDGIPAQAGLLQTTVNQVSDWGVGNKDMAPVVIVGLHSPALEWAMRDHAMTVVDTLDASSSPYFVITPLQNNPTLASGYRGQDFTWRETPAWEIAQPKDWLRWIALREMPQNGETIILWARDDLFINAKKTP